MIVIAARGADLSPGIAEKTRTASEAVVETVTERGARAGTGKEKGTAESGKEAEAERGNGHGPGSVVESRSPRDEGHPSRKGLLS